MPSGVESRGRDVIGQERASRDSLDFLLAFSAYACPDSKSRACDEVGEKSQRRARGKKVWGKNGSLKVER